MRMGNALAVTLAAGVLASGCGAGGDGYGCSPGVCTATYEGTGKQDLEELGGEATVAVTATSKRGATVEAGGTKTKLAVGETKDFGRLRIKLTEREGDSTTLDVRSR